jgi:cell division protein FtsN
MDKKPRFFIYDRREVAALVLLGVMVAVFAFTLGVHLGKRAGGKSGTPVLADAASKGVEPVLAASPTDKEIEERARAKQPETNGVVSQATQEEFARTGTRLDSPRQAALPSESPSAPASAPATQRAAQPEHPVVSTQASPRYVLQIGSYPSLLMAQTKVHELEAQGLKSVIQKAEVTGMGTRFRVMVGGYSTRREAENAGVLYQSEKKVDTFIVAHGQS